MAYKHVIFDWNGTLMDDAWLCVEIMNGILARRSLPLIDPESYRQWFQFPVQQYYEHLGFDDERDPFSVVSHEFIDAYEARRTECALFPGAQDILARWHAEGVELVILSAYQQRTLEEIVAHYGLAAYFDQLIGLDNIYAEGKTRNAERHVASIPHAPHELLLIGDTVHDFEVAEAIGADCLLVAHGHNGTARLEATGAPVVSGLAEAAERLAGALTPTRIAQ